MEPKAGIPAARLESTQYPGGGATPTSPVNTAQGLSPDRVDGVEAASPARLLLDEVIVPARIAAVSGVRERMADAARSIGFSDEAVDGIRLAVGEAFVNAVKHGSRPPEFTGDDDAGEDVPAAPIDLRAFQDGDALVVEIQDQGSGFQPDDVI
ncbi:MAG: ATP-binding protein, partial [Armatimonadota bacterium]|nr:ATP-binding protein [Armatimonadota bacterium]